MLIAPTLVTSTSMCRVALTWAFNTNCILCKSLPPAMNARQTSCTKWKPKRHLSALTASHTIPISNNRHLTIVGPFCTHLMHLAASKQFSLLNAKQLHTGCVRNGIELNWLHKQPHSKKRKRLQADGRRIGLVFCFGARSAFFFNFNWATHRRRVMPHNNKQ